MTVTFETFVRRSEGHGLAVAAPVDQERVIRRVRIVPEHPEYLRVRATPGGLFVAIFMPGAGRADPIEGHVLVTLLGGEPGSQGFVHTLRRPEDLETQLARALPPVPDPVKEQEIAPAVVAKPRKRPVETIETVDGDESLAMPFSPLHGFTPHSVVETLRTVGNKHYRHRVIRPYPDPAEEVDER